MALHLTKKAKVLLSILGVLILAGSIGYVVWTNTQSEVLPTDIEASPSDGCSGCDGGQELWWSSKANDGKGACRSRSSVSCRQEQREEEKNKQDSCEAVCTCSCGDLCADGGTVGCNSICKDSCGDLPIYEFGIPFTTGGDTSQPNVCTCGDQVYTFETSNIQCNNDAGTGGCDWVASDPDRYTTESGSCSGSGCTADVGAGCTIARYECIGYTDGAGGCQDKTTGYSNDGGTLGFQGVPGNCGMEQIDVDCGGAGSGPEAYNSKVYTDGCTEEDKEEFETQKLCGDGNVDAGEVCDDGNDVDNDECSNSCDFVTTASVCGDGVIDPGEVCDDGNTVDGDGCSALCLPEGEPVFVMTKSGAEQCVGDPASESQVTYTVTLTNSGDTAGSVTQVVDQLDSMVQEAWINVSSIVPSAGVTVSGNTITWDLDAASQSFDPGEQMSFQYQLTVPATGFGSLTNLVTAYVADAGIEDATATSTITVDCVIDTPSTGLLDSMISRVTVALLLLGAGSFYLYSDSGDRFILEIAGDKARLTKKRKSFEKKV